MQHMLLDGSMVKVSQEACICAADCHGMGSGVKPACESQKAFLGSAARARAWPALSWRFSGSTEHFVCGVVGSSSGRACR